MDIDRLDKEFKEYAERMSKIKILSSPKINTIDSADDYSKRLQANFKEIGRLAAINREMLDNELYPLLESTGTMDEGIVEELENLAEMLLNLGGEEDNFENLDLPVSSCIRNRLLDDAEIKDDILTKIRMIDAESDACYSMMNMTERISIDPKISGIYKERGIELGKRMLSLLDKDSFLTIPDIEYRKRILVVARFMSAFYERSHNACDNASNLEVLDFMMDIAHDSFYKKAVPDYDWKYFEFRTLESYLLCTDINNARGFNKDQIKLICRRAEELDDLIKEDPDYYDQIPGISCIPLHKKRCEFLAGFISEEEYKAYIINTYFNRYKDNFGVDGGLMNLLLPVEFISLLDPDELNSKDMLTIKSMYQGLNAFLFNSPTNGVLSFMLEYLTELINRFIEIPSGYSLKEFVLQSIAAMHPPTYVHSLMVGQISERLCYHLVRYNPELFIGVSGYDSVEDVVNHKDDIIRYTYNAAVCHDFGKIYIIDTISVYGRRILDLEFDLIKSHPEMGYNLLKGQSSTRDYAEVALLHHKWYNDERGYPEGYKTSDSKYKTIIDLIQCADCLDAATDTVGRSYNKGKTLDDFMEELKEGSGTRYASWLYGLFEHENVFSDIEYLLNEGRKRNYRETYNLLRGVKEGND